MAVFANYHPQRQQLSQLLELSNSSSAVFVVGRADYGKTWLLRWFDDNHGSSARIVLFELNDPSQTFTPSLIMTACAHEVGAEYFTEFHAKAAAVAPNRQAIVSNVSIQGDHNTIVAKTGETENDQLEIAIELTTHFVSGLRAASRNGPPIIICLDGYSSSQSLIGRWIELSLLRAIAPLSAVRLIVTGREPPSDNIRRKIKSAILIELDGVKEPDEWLRVVDELGKRLPVSTPEDSSVFIRGVIDVVYGAPGGIMRWLQTLPSKGV